MNLRTCVFVRLLNVPSYEHTGSKGSLKPLQNLKLRFL